MLSIDNGDGSRLGSPPFASRPRRPGPFELRPGEFSHDQRDAARLGLVCDIWSVKTGQGNAGRGISKRARADRENVRFHPALKHIDGGHWPAMVCPVKRGIGEAPLAIHRTFLSHDGVASKAPVAAARDAALRWKNEGRRVRIARPPQGMDFNDLLSVRAPSIEEDAR